MSNEPNRVSPESSTPNPPAPPATDTPETQPAETSAAQPEAGRDSAAAEAESSGLSEGTTSPAAGSATPREQSQAAKPGAGPLAARGLGVAKPASPAISPDQLERGGQSGQQPGAGKGQKKKKRAPLPRLRGEQAASSPATPPQAGDPAAQSVPEQSAAGQPAKQQPPQRRGRVAVPSVRGGLSDDLQAELDAELAAADVESMLGGGAGMPERREPLADGARVAGKVLKIHQDSVYLSLGGPDEGVVPLEQFTEEEPTAGSTVEVLVRAFNRDDGLYVCGLPGSTVEVADWSDLEEGSVVEATVTGHNSGGLECKVGSVRGFIPISQIAEYRVEDASEFVDQRLVCLVTEANERRGNLVLSRRAILEREREQKRAEQLEKLETGDVLEGVVRSIKDFGAFVDLGALDGLIHVSKLSWDRIKHPSEVLEVGQKVKVKVDAVDKESGRIGLSYRDLLENPWDAAETEFAVGTVHRGTVTRIASFGCFVRLAAGIEGLVHVSELAHHRVSKVDAFVSEGQEVDVKVLSFDRESQKIGLSMKAAQKLAEDAAKPKEEPEEEPQRDVAVKPAHQGPLKGGNNRETGGERFGLRW